MERVTGFPGLLVLAAALILPGSGFAQSSVRLTVPGTADPWLAGMPPGSTASCGDTGCDVGPDESPVQVALPLTAGSIVNFTASGAVSNGPPNPLFGPNGDPSEVGPHVAGAENGISDLVAPVDALVGVFLDDQSPDTSPAPSAGSNTVPALKQVFLIGSFSQVTVPAGATRLFLGTKDGWGWFNNVGSFTVDVSPCVSPCQLIPALSQWGVISLSCLALAFVLWMGERGKGRYAR